MENIIVNCKECPDCCAFLEGKDYEWYSCYNFFKEYNTDTSAGHPVKDDDIVRYSFEKRRVKDKEP